MLRTVLDSPARYAPKCEIHGRRFASVILFLAQSRLQKCPDVRVPGRSSFVPVPGKSAQDRSRPAGTAPATQRQAQKARSIRSRDSEPPPQFLLDPVHLTVFASVFIPHQVQIILKNTNAT